MGDPRPMYCRQCHYDLRHLDKSVCPECGTTFDKRSAVTYLDVVPRGRGTIWALAILLAMAAAAVVISMDDSVATMLAFALSTALAGVIGTVDAIRRHSPVTYRGFGGYGGAFCAVCVTCMTILLAHGWFVAGFFFYRGARPYFEDGWVDEVFLYPVFFCFFYGVAGGLIGMITGTMTSLCMGLHGRAHA